MRIREWVVRFGVVGLLVGVCFLAQGKWAPRPARAAEPEIKIMPLGDSITSGTDASYSQPLASYRCELQKKLVAAGYSFDFVGSVHGQWGVNSFPLLPPPGYCTMGDLDEEGHSGWRVDHILNGAGSWPGKLQTWAAAAGPDIVLVHLGTVDLTENQSVSSTVSEIGQVIDVLRAANPRVKILLAQILPASKDGVNGAELPTIPQFNALLPALVASKAQWYSPIQLVDMHTDFNVKDHTVDGVHPNENGENKMAGRWKTAIDQIMSIKSPTFIPLVNR